jgi:hypothetical protein
MEERLGGPVDDYLLELISIALQALEDKAPRRRKKMSDRTLATYLFNKVNEAVKEYQAVYHQLILKSLEIQDPGELRMAQMIAESDSLALLERMLRDVPEEENNLSPY